MNAVLRYCHQKFCKLKEYSFFQQRIGNYHQRGAMLIDAKQTVTCKMRYLRTITSFVHLTMSKNHLV